jgi:plastocyanin
MPGIRIGSTGGIVGAIVASLVVAAAATAGTTRTSGSAGTIAFTAAYAGKATVTVTDAVANISASGPGTATVIGASTVSGTGVGNTAVQPCVPFTGTGTITAKSGGTTLRFSVQPGSQGCGDESGSVFSIVGRAKVTGGTGSMAEATGTLKLTGTYNRGAGTFSIKLKGNLTTAGTAQVTTVLRITGGKSNKLAFSTKALTARAGKVTIVMRNLSGAPHNIAIRKGATARSPILVKGKVVGKGKTSTVTATLKKGRYRYVCTVRGHEGAGMWGILTVR